MKINEALDQWLVVSGVGKKPRTQKYHVEIVGTIRRLWPGDCDAAAESVTDQVLTEFISRIARFSATRFNAIVSALKLALPAARLLKRRPVRVKERPLLSQLEFSRLLDELDHRPQSHAGLVIRFLAHTGLRINEARQLLWSDVQDDFILAPGRITKTGRPRGIPFVNGLAETLAALRAIAGADRLVCPQADCKRSLQTACRRAGLPRLSHHDFRHLFATRCIQSRVDLPTVARWLGHSDGGALLAKTYYHLADEHSRKMAAKVEIGVEEPHVREISLQFEI